MTHPGHPEPPPLMMLTRALARGPQQGRGGCDAPVPPLPLPHKTMAPFPAPHPHPHPALGESHC